MARRLQVLIHMKTKYRIIDWAGNDLTSYYGTFDSFEDAWGAIYERFEHLSDEDLDEQLGEFEVIDYVPGQKRYIDPFDPRASLTPFFVNLPKK